MSEAMRVKLIQSKMLNGRSNKLCCAIDCTADYLTKRTTSVLYKVYVETLARLAASSMIYWDLIQCLSTPVDTYISSHEIRENALLAATKANQLPLVKKILAQNLSIRASSRYFGEVLSTAASTGSLSMVSVLLETRGWDHYKQLYNARYIHALQAAAVAGHKHVVLMLLNRGKPLAKSLYDDAIMHTVKANASMVKLLLSHRQQRSDSNKERTFWINLLRSATSWDRRTLLHNIMLEGRSHLEEAAIAMAVEEGCRKGHCDSVEILLSNLPSPPTSEAVCCNGGLFWAGRSDSSRCLESFENLLRQERHQIVRALSGAISGRRRSNITYLLRIAGVNIKDQDAPMRFTDIARLVLPEAFSVIPSEGSKSLTCLAREAVDASKSGDLIAVIKSFRTAKKQHPDHNLLPFSAAFNAAAKNNHTDILMYLCENHTPHLFSTCARSTAIARIFLDFGWDFNKPEPASQYVCFGNFVHDELFCRWLIDNGASVSARGDMDVTPTSVAVAQGPMSTIKLFLERCRGVLYGQLLHFATERHNEDVLEVIEILLNLGCPINSVMYQDHPYSWWLKSREEVGTPLFKAVELERLEIVEYLLFRGADPASRSSKGRTPLEAAESKGYTSIMSLLKRYG